MNDCEQLIATFAEGQGWTEHSQIVLLCRFIQQAGLATSLENFLQAQADDENGAEED